jgi:hypothetical protein
MSGSYNAVTWLLDRNVDEGRGAKLAFTDTVSELTYGDLQRQSCRVANMLRRLGVRRVERVAMIMLDTVDFPSVFLGAIRAGIVPVPLNTLLTADQYAYVLADCRARVLFISEALLPVVKDMVGRMPDLEHVVVAGQDALGHKKLADELARDLVGEFLVPVGIVTGNNDVLEIRHPADHGLHDRQQRFGDEQHPGAAIRQHIGVLIRRQQRVERHRHYPGADRAEKHRREIDGVEHDHGHPLFAADAETAQRVGDAAALLLQRAVGQFGNRVGEGELAATALVDIAVEQPAHGIVGTGGAVHAALRELKRVTTFLPNI